jgi:hypothetical protein
MSKFVVSEHRLETDDPGVPSMLFGYNVLETRDDGVFVQQMNDRTLGSKEARDLAATLTWMVHLDAWMVSVVEDEDVVVEIGDLLGMQYVPGTDEQIEHDHDRMVVEVLRLLPDGLRRLADRYEQEWANKAATV